MATYRKTGLSITVWKFVVGATPAYLGSLIDAELEIETAEEDAAGIADLWDYSWATGKNWRLSFNQFVAADDAAASDTSTAFLMPLAGTQVNWNCNSGGNTYQGTGLMKMASHRMDKRALQKQRGQILAQGALTIS